LCTQRSGEYSRRAPETECVCRGGGRSRGVSVVAPVRMWRSRSDDPRGSGVSGTVTFDGQPVPFGRIVFTPDREAGNSGPQGFAEIRNGAYDTASGKGTVGGPQVVQITGFGADPATGDEENPVPALFPEFETKCDLPKSSIVAGFRRPGRLERGADGHAPRSRAVAPVPEG
jgi:hypothetical protein